jgi:hypothetical protein
MLKPQQFWYGELGRDRRIHSECIRVKHNLNSTCGCVPELFPFETLSVNIQR